jgi:hypothetical protein
MGAGCIDRRESSRERSPPAWSQRNGTGKRRRSEEVWLMTCRLCVVSAATSARSRMRTPRSRSCGRRNVGMGRAARVVHPARYPTAVVGRRQAARALEGSGRRLHLKTVADIKSECQPASSRNPRPVARATRPGIDQPMMMTANKGSAAPRAGVKHRSTCALAAVSMQPRRALFSSVAT